MPLAGSKNTGFPFFGPKTRMISLKPPKRTSRQGKIFSRCIAPVITYPFAMGFWWRMIDSMLRME